MTKLISNKGYLGFCKQTSRTHPASAPEHYVRYSEAKFIPDQATTVLKEGGDGEYAKTVIKNSHKEKFNFKCAARPELVAYILAYLLGDDTKAGASDPYTHTIIRGTSRLWLTLWRKIKDLVVQRVEGAKISTVTIEGEAGKEITLAVEGEGCWGTVLGSETVPTYETSAPFVFYHGNGRFKNDGAVTSEIKKFSIKIAVKGEALQTDDVVPGDIPDQALDIDVKLELYAASSAEWKKANYNNGASVSSGIYMGSMELDLQYTESAKIRQLKITIPNMTWQSIDIPMAGNPEPVTQEIAGIAVKNSADELITVVCKNDLSATLADAGS